jgi:hypothetical protein
MEGFLLVLFVCGTLLGLLLLICLWVGGAADDAAGRGE